jgi:predicted ArsR family transcriptional regulator
VLVALRRAGPLSPDALAQRLGISRTSAVQQLRGLALKGLVSRRAVRHGVGRPRHLYDLTSSAQALFPNGYEALVGDLLGALEDLGGRELAERAFRLRRARLREAILRRFAERGVLEAPLEVRALELARFQDDQGYLCECRRESRRGGPSGVANGHDGPASDDPLVIDGRGVIRLREHNCAIYDVARHDPMPCREEARLFSEVLGARVVRESHIASGDRSCTYRIEERPARA